MAISQTILGPNSSMFTFGVGETPTTVMAAVDAYITSHGWELYDTLPSPSVSRVYRTLQHGSETMYKYVNLSFSTSSFSLTICESWNTTTHVGTNVVNSLNFGTIGTDVANVSVVSMGYAEGSAIIMFVNQKWLAARYRTNTLVFGDTLGSFEISKDFNEPETTPSNILLTSGTYTTYPGTSSSTTNGFYGTMVNNNTVGTPAIVSRYTNIVTTVGMPVNNAFTLGTMISGSNINSALTMTAVELTGTTSSNPIARFRGRIMGTKLVYGISVWNDMDTCQILCDSEYHQSAIGEPIQHHIIAPASNRVRYLIPA
jgi:hypothetical protein